MDHFITAGTSNQLSAWGGDMTSDSTIGSPGSISPEAYPAPVLQYDFSDSEPVIKAVCSTFRSEFGAVSELKPLADGLNAVGLTLLDADGELEKRIKNGETFGVCFEVEGGSPSEPRCATVVPELDRSGGHIIFSCRSDGGHNLTNKIGVTHVASVVSHDLRNPLEVAKTRLRAARDTGEARHFDRVEGAHERMERIIEDVLTLARGEDTVNPSTNTDLTEIARSAWETIDNDEATLVVDSTLPTAMIDQDRTSRVFENLFRNSVEHGSATNNGQSDNQIADGPEIRIGAIESDTTEGFYIADDGEGIEPDEREAVRKPGYTTNQHGTGLGLAIVDQIAEAHGWTLTITSSAADGARIEVTNL